MTVEIRIIDENTDVVSSLLAIIRTQFEHKIKMNVFRYTERDRRDFDDIFHQFASWYNTPSQERWGDPLMQMAEDLGRQEGLLKLPEVWSKFEKYVEYPIHVDTNFVIGWDIDKWKRFIRTCGIDESKILYSNEYNNVAFSHNPSPLEDM